HSDQSLSAKEVVPPSFFLPLSLTENRRAYAHKRRTLFDRDGIILRHAHRKLGEIDTELGLKSIAQLAQLHKILPRCFRFLGNWWNTHETQDRQPGEREKRFQFRAQFLGRESKLAPLACHVDLE